jgi:drug/metabolite transporter (DMT)-like permease
MVNMAPVDTTGTARRQLILLHCGKIHFPRTKDGSGSDLGLPLDAGRVYHDWMSTPRSPLSALPLIGSSAPAKAILLMLTASLMVTVNDAIAKWLTAHYPTGEILAVRGAMVISLAVCWALARRRPDLLRVRNWKAQLTRGVLMCVSTFLFVTSLKLLPIADAIAISFAGPVFATMLAALILKEPVGWRRWTAIGIGFIGVLIMVRPAPEIFRLVALLPVLAAFIGAFRDIVTRSMSTGGESTIATLVASTSVVAFGGLLTLPWGWVPISWEHLGLFAVTATLVGIAQACMIEAFRWGEVGLIGPFKYSSLVWAVLLGSLVWGDLPGPWTLVGASVLIGSGLYIWRREAVLARQQRVAEPLALPNRQL